MQRLCRVHTQREGEMEKKHRDSQSPNHFYDFQQFKIEYKGLIILAIHYGLVYPMDSQTLEKPYWALYPTTSHLKFNVAL